MNARTLRQFVRQVLIEVSYGVEFGYPTADPKLFIRDKDNEDDVGVGSSIVTAYPQITHVQLQDEELNPQSREIEVISALRGGWYEGQTKEESDENRMAYTRTMGYIKSMASGLKANNDPEFKSLLERSANFLSSHIAKAKKKIDYVVVAESTSSLGMQYAEVLAKKLGATFESLQQDPVLSKKTADNMEVFRLRIKHELKNRFEKELGRKLSDEELTSLPEYQQEFQNYEKRVLSTIKSTKNAGKKAGTEFRIQGTGGQGFRRFIKGGFELPQPDRFAGKTVLIVDDNVSEGWTIRELARQALLAGADDVFGAVVWKWGQPVELPRTAERKARQKKSKDATERSKETAAAALRKNFEALPDATLPFRQADDLKVGQAVRNAAGASIGKIVDVQGNEVTVATPAEGMKKYRRMP